MVCGSFYLHLTKSILTDSLSSPSSRTAKQLLILIDVYLIKRCKGNTKIPTTQFIEAEYTKEGNNVRFLKFTFAFSYIFIIFASNKNTYMKKMFLLILCLMPLSLLAQTYKM